MYEEFIHTFCVEVYLTSSHVEQMVSAYGNDFIYNHIDKKFFFCKYMEYGFRMEVVYTDNKVKQYDKEHRSYKASWIVTPAKLLYPGEPMQKLHTPEEYAQACTVLGGILDEIKKTLGWIYSEKQKSAELTLPETSKLPRRHIQKKRSVWQRKLCGNMDLWDGKRNQIQKNGRTKMRRFSTTTIRKFMRRYTTNWRTCRIMGMILLHIRDSCDLN